MATRFLESGLPKLELDNVQRFVHWVQPAARTGDAELDAEVEAILGAELGAHFASELDTSNPQPAGACADLQPVGWLLRIFAIAYACLLCYRYSPTLVCRCSCTCSATGAWVPQWTQRRYFDLIPSHDAHVLRKRVQEYLNHELTLLQVLIARHGLDHMLALNTQKVAPNVTNQKPQVHWVLERLQPPAELAALPQLVKELLEEASSDQVQVTAQDATAKFLSKVGVTPN